MWNAMKSERYGFFLLGIYSLVYENHELLSPTQCEHDWIMLHGQAVIFQVVPLDFKKTSKSFFLWPASSGYLPKNSL